MGRNWAEICLQCSTGFVYCLWKIFEAKTGLGHYKLSFDTINIEVWSLEIAPVAENCSKMGRNWAEICLQCSVDFVFCLWKNFSNQNWWGTLKALILDHEHWGLIILSCPKGKKKAQKRDESGLKILILPNLFTFLLLWTIEIIKNQCEWSFLKACGVFQ